MQHSLTPNGSGLHKPPLLTVKQAFFWMLLITMGVVGSAGGGLLYYRYVRAWRMQDPKYTVIALAQRSASPERLKSSYFAELLDLSVDRPTNLYRLNIAEATQKLLASPLIKMAEITKIPPGTLCIEYAMRRPVAFLKDYANTAIDSEGYLFPFNPFFTPKRLPQVYLGLASQNKVEQIWGQQVSQPTMQLTLEMLERVPQMFPEETGMIWWIDVSQIHIKHGDIKEIVLGIVEKQKEESARFPVLLRLAFHDYVDGILRYQKLRGHLKLWRTNETPSKPLVIDLRLPQLAFVTPTKDIFTGELK